MGGSVGTGSNSSLSEELMGSNTSSVWRGSEATEERGFTGGSQVPEGLYFLNSFLEIDC